MTKKARPVAPAERLQVLLVVSGGIAAYKAPALVREFKKRGASVQVVATQSALAFTTELSLRTVSGQGVRSSLLDPAQEGTVGHIELADRPDLVVVAPATANLMAKAASGQADDLASTVLLATTAPVLWAPAMNTNMWRHPATVANLATLKQRGAHFVGPDAGELACGWIGEGRMMDPAVIVDAAMALTAQRATPPDWTGRRVLVSAGPTRTYIDPVRFLTNASTGEMGFAVAEAAAARGAETVLVAGPVDRPTPAGVARVDVDTAEEMLEAMERILGERRQNLVAMVAAVSDFRSKPNPAKLPKQDLLASLGAGLTQGVDVLATLAKRHREASFFLGFAAQTVADGDQASVGEALASAGRTKLQAKGCHAIFVNRVGVPGTGFGSPTNTGVYLRAGEEQARDAGPPVKKRVLADWLLDQVAGDMTDD